MRVAGPPSWRISEDRWPEAFDVALWFRAAERIDVASEGVVPGAPDVEPLPDPGTDPSDAAELAAGWLAWWHSLVGCPRYHRRSTRPARPRCWRSARQISPAWRPGLRYGGLSPAGGGRLMTGTTPARRRDWRRACTTIGEPARW
jgi:hypothetical protein